MSVLLLALALTGFLGNFLKNISLEYRTSVYAFLRSYVLNWLETFLAKMLEGTLVLVGLGRILRWMESDYEVNRLFWVLVPAMAVLSFSPAFFDQRSSGHFFIATMFIGRNIQA